MKLLGPFIFIIISLMAFALFVAGCSQNNGPSPTSSRSFTIGGAHPSLNVEVALAAWGKPQKEQPTQLTWLSGSDFSRAMVLGEGKSIVELAGTQLEDRGVTVLRAGDSLAKARELLGAQLREHAMAPMVSSTAPDALGHRLSISYRTISGRLWNSEVVDRIYLAAPPSVGS